ncbi:cell division protein FtsQ [Chryseobacterium sp. Ch-15]|uniref:Cell division protein FtsQ n=1 Tax=Chryseobacterium muglaense TaxID=2893752 RepID=A0A9Q3YW36_9FLAO|nr:cell division protein FtsQ [Chryseobacterium muglaense]MBD3904363.1 cell division protein FtsQ [Chryseobacterium muglaense]MCC9035320.1 cell division protein FtsQ [Chryseobacterium muglaense]MCM2554015.1 cell division protein FtsQ [Chryseobacterium muglaense]
MKNKYRILKIAITVIILGFLLSFSLKKFGGQKITDNKISVKMNEKTPVYFIDEKDIREIVNKENPSRKVGDLNIPELEKKINALPAVDSANVYLNLNGKLNLDIKQRVPIFRLNYKGKDFYVDEKGVEFPISRTYSHPCMLVTGDVKKDEYEKLAELVDKIDKDDFSKKYFIGISKYKDSYNLLTSEGIYRVEIGDLDNIELKVKGFKTFVEKYLVFQDPQKYKMISVKYQNQIVTTLNPYFKENDSILKASHKDLVKAPVVVSSVIKPEINLKPTVKKASSASLKPKENTKPKAVVKPKEKNKKTTKPKAKVTIE